MKSTKSPKAFQLSFWPVVISLFIFAFLLAPQAQGQSSMPNLLRTGWKATAEIPMKPILAQSPESTLHMQFAIEFIENWKVQAVIFSQLHGYQARLKYNPYTGREDRTEFEPTIISNLKGIDVGTYRQNGNAIHISFSEVVVDGTVQDTLMEGTISVKKSGERAKWKAQRVSNDTRRESNKIFGNPASANSGDENSSYPNVVRNAEGELSPASGYRWVNSEDPKDFRVELMPGLIVAEKGKLRPAKGYRWVNADDPKDFRVERIP